MNRDQVLGRLAPLIGELRRRYAVKDLALFGSAARNQAGPGSDLDFNQQQVQDELARWEEPIEE